MEERFWSKVKKTDYCWIWTASELGKGYGSFSIPRSIRKKGEGHSIKAHRVSWTIHFGKIPKGLCVLHKCDNRKCVNPSHLFLGTVADNNKDMWEKGRGVIPTKLSTALVAII